MLQRNIASRYATALFLAARDNGQLEAVETAFPPIAAAVRDDADLNRFLAHPAIAPEEKKKVLQQLMAGLKDKANEMLFDYLCLVVDKQREEYIPLMCEVFLERLMEHRSQVTARVETPYALTEDLKQGLRDKLGKVTGKAIILEEVVKPGLMGGVLVRLGDRVIDGTVMHRLDQMKETLKAVKV
jgi:F-type H+-transporting ATPase subunit delta